MSRQYSRTGEHRCTRLLIFVLIIDSSRLSRRGDHYGTYPRHDYNRSQHDYGQEELSLTSTFSGLGLSHIRDGRLGRSASHTSAVPASPQRHTARNAGGLGDAAALRRRAQPIESNPNTGIQHSLDLVPVNRRNSLTSRDVRPYQNPLPTAPVEDSSAYRPSSSRYGRYNHRQVPNINPITQLLPHYFSRERYVFSREVPLPDRSTGRPVYAGADTGVLCMCRICVEHRYPSRHCTLASYSHPGSRRTPAYGRYNSVTRRPHYSPARADWLYGDEDYDSPDYDSDSLNDIYEDDAAYRHPFEPDMNAIHDPYFEDYESDPSYGSDHEYSDGASYTGNGYYDDNSDGEYSAGGYPD
ncbi:hypothetical protein AX15_007271 [Amanita polypyramis BW_CC]|nr:hypothetical protein AX15_007271 [Amanita polypyramis BW_CC]